MQQANSVVESGVYPNPAAGGAVTFWLTLAGAEPPPEPATLRVFDALGRVVWQTERRVVIGRNEWRWEAAVSPGLYNYEWAGVRGKLLVL